MQVDVELDLVALVGQGVRLVLMPDPRLPHGDVEHAPGREPERVPEDKALISLAGTPLRKDWS